MRSVARSRLAIVAGALLWTAATAQSAVEAAANSAASSAILDDCASCLHGTCRPVPPDGHICVCDQGWAGSTCDFYESDLDYQSRFHPNAAISVEVPAEEEANAMRRPKRDRRKMIATVEEEREEGGSIFNEDEKQLLRFLSSSLSMR